MWGSYLSRALSGVFSDDFRVLLCVYYCRLSKIITASPAVNYSTYSSIQTLPVAFHVLGFFLLLMSFQTLFTYYLWLKETQKIFKTATLNHIVCWEALGCHNKESEMRKVTFHFINILINVYLQYVCMKNLLNLKKMETSGFKDIAALVMGKVDTTHCYHGNTERTAVPQSN